MVQCKAQYDGQTSTPVAIYGPCRIKHDKYTRVKLYGAIQTSTRATVYSVM